MTLLKKESALTVTAGHDNPEDDKKIRDELTSAALSIKQLDDNNEKLIIYGNNLSSWFNAVAAAYGKP
jgi:hypothetical protein